MLKYVYNVYGNKGMIWIVYVLCEVLRTTMKRGALYIPSLLSFFFLFFKNIFLIIQEHCFFLKPEDNYALLFLCWSLDSVYGSLRLHVERSWQEHTLKYSYCELLNYLVRVI